MLGKQQNVTIYTLQYKLYISGQFVNSMIKLKKKYQYYTLRFKESSAIFYFYYNRHYSFWHSIVNWILWLLFTWILLETITVKTLLNLNMKIFIHQFKYVLYTKEKIILHTFDYCSPTLKLEISNETKFERKIASSIVIFSWMYPFPIISITNVARFNSSLHKNDLSLRKM